MARIPTARPFDPWTPSKQMALPEETPGWGSVTALYRFYDAERQLLYVGVTGQPHERWPRHRRTAAWWPAVAFVSVVLCPTECAALAAERESIRSEHPKHNKRSQLGVRSA